MNLNNYTLHVTLDGNPIPASLSVRFFSSAGINVRPGRYLCEADGTPRYMARVPIGRKDENMDNGKPAPKPGKER